MKLFKDRPVVSKGDGLDGWFSRGYLPHFDGVRVTQHVCFGLFDSLPQDRLRLWREELKHQSKEEANVEWCRRIEVFLDRGYGNCFLRDPRLAAVVEGALLFFEGTRYSMHAWCVMPNHVHALFTPDVGHRTSDILRSWRSYTANRCNKLLGRTGSFWQKEPFDRYIRNERHYQNVVRYIENNPVKAGLCERPEDWCWSSARRRVQTG